MADNASIKPLFIGRHRRGPDTVVTDIQQALALLTEQWVPQRGPRHRDAVETCLKVLDGHRSSQEARRALIEAAVEAGFSVSQAE